MTKQEIYRAAIHTARIELARAQQRLDWCPEDELKEAAKDVIAARKKLDRLEREATA